MGGSPGQSCAGCAGLWMFTMAGATQRLSSSLLITSLWEVILAALVMRSAPDLIEVYRTLLCKPTEQICV